MTLIELIAEYCEILQNGGTRRGALKLLNDLCVDPDVITAIVATVNDRGLCIRAGGDEYEVTFE